MASADPAPTIAHEHLSDRGAPGVESAIIVRVPTADDLVGDLRQRFDPAAAWGVPAHITVLYPWIPPAELSLATLHRLAEVVQRIPAFNARLASVQWFPGDVMYLAPEPQDAFTAVFDTVHSAYPEYPPYEGRYAESIPHLTVAQGVPHEDIAAECDDVARRLPVAFPVAELCVLCGGPELGVWHTVAQYRLGAGPPGQR